MRIAIRQQLSIPVGAGATRAVQHLLLTPISCATQSVREWRIDMPGFDGAARFLDGFGNLAHLVTQSRPEEPIIVTVTGLVETHDQHGVLGRLPTDPVPALFRRVTRLTPAAETLVAPLRGSPALARDRIGVLHTLMAQVAEAFGQGPETDGQSQSQSQKQTGGATKSQSQSQSSGAEEGSTSLVRAGAMAHAFIGAARTLDIPARYVTGYLAATEDAPRAFHAWAEAYDDNLGWIGFDAALGLCPTESHVRLAAGLDAESAAPVRATPSVGQPELLAISIEPAGGGQ